MLNLTENLGLFWYSKTKGFSDLKFEKFHNLIKVTLVSLLINRIH